MLRPSELWILAWEQSRDNNPRTTDDAVEEQFWRERAAGFDEQHPLAPLVDELMSSVCASLQRDDHLLEIGSGTGGFTRLLAPHVGALTVVEPSASMAEVFRKNWERTGFRSPVVIQEKWENTPEIQADVLFGANAFYRIRDMKKALLQMNAAAKRHVFLLQSVGKPNTKQVQVSVRGKHYEWERAVLMSGILFELGILHQYRSFQVKRLNGTIHEVALIDWEKTSGIKGEGGE
ncbi:class I SAM-dependent methyltransferase [Paenibacillus senegalensis]|uniref:class I SAM-dependent methyltransferase n=1 Tax=Paenibacillus senegalensis TaxID=1465766 RepID=UPI000288F5CC|nr:methyltransferase domain-containing protein [Paenibacillus senegalensis]